MRFCLAFIIIFYTLSAHSQIVSTEKIQAIIDEYADNMHRFSLNSKDSTLLIKDSFGVISVNIFNLNLHIEESTQEIILKCKENDCIHSLGADNEPLDNRLTYYGILFNLNKWKDFNKDSFVDEWQNLKSQFILKAPESTFKTISAGSINTLDIVKKINTLFYVHEENEGKLSYDDATKTLMYYYKDCFIRLPLYNITVRSSKSQYNPPYVEELIVESSDRDILKKCTGLPSYDVKALFYFDKNEKLIEVIELLETLIIKSKISLALMDSQDNETMIILHELNELFNKYNNYHTVFFIEPSKQDLIWLNDFGVHRVKLKALNVDIDNKNDVLKINNDSQNIVQENYIGKKISFKEYTFSLRENNAPNSVLREAEKLFKLLIKKFSN